jgi:Tfp pilus assembly protein PilF
MIFNGPSTRAPRPVFLIFGILLLTFLAFSPALHNGFTNWDDPEYLLENPLIRSISSENVKHLFTTHLSGKYHPLTLLSYSLEYRFFQMTPRIYHLTNLLLHLTNVILVFYFLRLIVPDIYIVTVTTLLFAIHPLHVEPVAWVSGRKDLLCTVFSLLCLLSYTHYLKKTSRTFFLCLATFILFVLAMLSKAMAVTLPCVLVLLDYYFRRKLDIRNLVEKIPFFAVALGLGWRTWSAAREANGFPVTALFSLTDRFFLSAHAMILYLRKLAFPHSISSFYPLPDKAAGFFAPVVYFSAVLVPVFFIVIWLLGRKERLLRFALLFFVVGVTPVLHLARINDSIIYDRFVYLASVGIFLIIAWLCRRVAESLAFLKGNSVAFMKRGIEIQRLMTFLVPAYILYLSFFSWNRCHVWQDSFTLWTDVIKQFRGSGLAYLNRSSHLLEDNKPKLAILDAYAAVKFSPHYAQSFLTRGQVFAALGEDSLAVADFDKAIALDPSYATVYFERGNIHFKRNKYDSALNDFTNVIHLDARAEKAFNNRGNAYLLSGRASAAIEDYTKALAIDPRYTDAYSNRAMAYILLGDSDRALRDLNDALWLDPAGVTARVAKAHLEAEEK